jgi:ComF family protein
MDPFVSPIALALADLVCPERCAACPAIVASGALFCQGCRRAVRVLGPPECAGCGSPLGAGTCPPCPLGPGAPIRRARAWGAYRGADAEQPVARALAAFKYGGAMRLGRRMAAAMASRAPDASVSLVAPVPLHPRRLRRRGFNQSAVLARHLARALGRAAAPRLLARTRDTPSQTALAAAARRANVAGAFAVRRPAAVRGVQVLLVDDVWTSGATALAAAAALRAAGARAVDVLTFARVL